MWVPGVQNVKDYFSVLSPPPSLFPETAVLIMTTTPRKIPFSKLKVSQGPNKREENVGLSLSFKMFMENVMDRKKGH